jgi:hypothetical protein
MCKLQTSPVRVIVLVFVQVVDRNDIIQDHLLPWGLGSTFVLSLPIVRLVKLSLARLSLVRLVNPLFTRPFPVRLCKFFPVFLYKLMTG